MKERELLFDLQLFAEGATEGQGTAGASPRPTGTAEGQGTGDGGSLPQSRLRRAGSLVRGSQEMGEERETPPGETAQGQGTGDGGSLPQSRLRRASSLVRGSQEMGEERETPPGGTAEGQEAQEPVAPAAAQVRAHFDALTAQAAELQKTFPGFSLAEELKNPVFLRMTAPGISIPLADAYYAVHHKELQTAAMQVTAQVTAQKLAASVQAGTLRPDESGGAQAPSVTAFNYASASRQQREALKQRIRAAAAQGKRIFP